MAGIRHLARAAWSDLGPHAVGPLLPLSPRTGWAPHALVGALTAVLAGFSWHTLLMDYGLPNEQAAALGVTHALAPVVCLYRPMAGWWLSLAMVVVTALAAASVHPLTDGPLWTGPSLAVHLSVLALVGLRVRPRVLVEMWLLTVAVGVVLAAVLPWRQEFPGPLEPVLLSGAVLVAAGALRGRGEAMRRLARQERISEQERSRRALLEERARIARELHDVVAHHMSVVAVQAEAAPYRVPDPPQELTRSFATIRASALEAMEELHRILGLLRTGPDAPGEARAERPGSRHGNLGTGGSGGSGRVSAAPGRSGPGSGKPAGDSRGESPGQREPSGAFADRTEDGLHGAGEHAPQPDLDRLEELVAGVREAGLAVSVRVTGERRRVPPGVGLSAYRIVQESLSNVLRHAPGAGVRVELAYAPDRLRVRVVNGPPAGAPAAILAGSGQGLVGMRERAIMLGGDLTAGPCPDGGYRVTAVLPLPPEGRA